MRYAVYMLATRKDGPLYVGVTNDLVRRVFEHRSDAVRGFTWQFNVHRLVWFEAHDSIEAAITREKQIKRWRRAWKIEMIETENPEWDDLYERIAGGSSADDPGSR
ncbi:GIY-YIG nuclease superfamily protein [Blastochloris viridis]|uniref:Excinuclease ABC n=2 Tax=Blastochloris viridis TaxID=1079 RepID=A0A0H5BI41_BLAVI|nr:GIY-YIG nuclease family protein [Blastochloris viridis]ALK09314.1 GIY-YIG nuclease superfamily protein [Blastochloris viridis]BAS00810.1 excinuclease ABC [Blastochloris viridis]CUU41977.1 GIY-YIG nuclease superfamily protein [Blastochloris viridis]